MVLLALVLQTSSKEVDICNHALTTEPVQDQSTMSGYGILFTVSSPYTTTAQINQQQEMIISSLGFYVDTNELASLDDTDVNYEVYTLQGYYADPQRTNGGNGGLPINSTFDYRGDSLEDWEKIATGSFDSSDLTSWPPNDWTNANYFQIPYSDFESVTLPPSSTEEEEVIVQSFYITLKEVGALLYSPIETWEDLHDEQRMMHCGATHSITNVPVGDGCVDGNNIKDKPIIHTGERVVSYPMTDVAYFYQPNKFMGTLYYLSECPTSSPTTTPSSSISPSKSLPTEAPTQSPSKGPLKPTQSPTKSSQPTMSYVYRGENGCDDFISTDRDYESFKSETTSSYGIVFPITSNDDDDDGLMITTLGFHVNLLDDSSDSSTVNYEVYVLKSEEIYADPNRTSTGPVSFDYRGNFDLWDKISTGSIQDKDLIGDYFQIPFTDFEQTLVPPNGRIRSFYLTLVDSNALVFHTAKKSQLGNVQKDDDYSNKNKDRPLLRYGEGIIGYPFHKSQFLYSPKNFVGKVFYEIACPSQEPSEAPTFTPSISVAPSSTSSPTAAPR